MTGDTEYRVLLAGRPGFVDPVRDAFRGFDHEMVLRAVETVDEALAHVATGSTPDLVVTAATVVDGTGSKLRDRTREEFPAMPFVLVTGGEAGSGDQAVEDDEQTTVFDLDDEGTAIVDLARHVLARLDPAHPDGRLVTPAPLDAIVSHTHDGIITIDEESTIRFVNPAIERIFGYDADELVGAPLTELMPPGYGERHLSAVDEYLDSGEQTLDWNRTELPGQHRDGEEIPLAISFGEFERQGDRYFTGIVRDISEQRQRITELRLKDRAMDAATVGIVITDPTQPDNPITYVNECFETLTGYQAESVLGRNCRLLQGPKTDPTTAERISHALASEEPISVDIRNYRADGTPFWNHLEIAPIHEDGEVTHFVGFLQDVTRRKRREDRITGLNQLLGTYFEADSAGRIASLTVDLAPDYLDLPLMVVAELDEDAGELRVLASTDLARESLDVTELLAGDGGIAWEVYASNEPRRLDARELESPPETAPMERLFVFPLGKHGVLVVGSSSGDFPFCRTVASNLRSALDRIEHEELLAERRAMLERQNIWLDRVNRVNTVVRNIDRALVRASSRATIVQAVCTELTAIDDYLFTWIGELDSATNEIVPTSWAGADAGYLDDVEFSSDGSSTESLAVKTREPAVEDSVVGDPPLDRWRRAAIQRGFRSVIAIPLLYQQSLYGVLAIYADEAGVFQDLEREVLRELGETIGYAMNAVESKKALVSDEIVELELRVDPEDHPLLEFIRTESATFELKGIVPTESDHYRVYYRIDNVDAAAIREFTDRTAAIRESTVIADRESGCTVECTVSDGNLIYWFLDRGAVPRAIEVDESGAKIVLELAESANVREFVELFEAEFSSAELVATRRRERPMVPRQEFLERFEAVATPRQQELIQTAFHSGYFESPRARTGSEIAEDLGIAQPTFSNNLRAGLRNLLSLLYGEGDSDFDS